jgi:hypothetical protein
MAFHNLAFHGVVACHICTCT